MRLTPCRLKSKFNGRMRIDDSTEYLFGLSIGVKAHIKPADEFRALSVTPFEMYLESDVSTDSRLKICGRSVVHACYY
jgi:hypothetical protein